MIATDRADRPAGGKCALPYPLGGAAPSLHLPPSRAAYKYSFFGRFFKENIHIKLVVELVELVNNPKGYSRVCGNGGKSGKRLKEKNKTVIFHGFHKPVKSTSKKTAGRIDIMT